MAATGPRPAPAHPTLPAPVVALLVRCWALEESDGGWPGGDLVVTLTGWFAGLGVNIEHPAARAYRVDPTRPDTDHGTWDADALALFAAEHATDDEPPALPAPAPADPARDENGDWLTCELHGGAITQDCGCTPAHGLGDLAAAVRVLADALPALSAGPGGYGSPAIAEQLTRTRHLTAARMVAAYHGATS